MSDRYQAAVPRRGSSAATRCGRYIGYRTELPAEGRSRCSSTGIAHLASLGAMNLLAAGVDLATIALFLGHSSTRANEVYFHADLTLKEQALARVAQLLSLRAVTIRRTRCSPSWRACNYAGKNSTDRPRIRMFRSSPGIVAHPA